MLYNLTKLQIKFSLLPEQAVALAMQPQRGQYSKRWLGCNLKGMADSSAPDHECLGTGLTCWGLCSGEMSSRLIMSHAETTASSPPVTSSAASIVNLIAVTACRRQTKNQPHRMASIALDGWRSCN